MLSSAVETDTRNLSFSVETESRSLVLKETHVNFTLFVSVQFSRGNIKKTSVRFLCWFIPRKKTHARFHPNCLDLFGYIVAFLYLGPISVETEVRFHMLHGIYVETDKRLLLLSWKARIHT